MSFIAFYDAVLKDRPRPRFSWKFEKDGTIRIRTVDKPTQVRLWQANNPEKRDFRLMSIGPAYKDSVLTERAGGTYLAQVEKPPKGWTAYFVELTFPSGSKYPFKFTTPVRVTPDVLPFPAPKAAASMAGAQ
jgi:PhoPQ-activated pathogenicity-related protein